MSKKRTANRLPGKKPTPMGGWLLFTLYFVCIALLVFSRLENSQIRHMRGILSDLVSPVLQAATQPAIYAQRSREHLVDYLDLFDELDRLKEENQKFRHWRGQAKRLERRLVRMRALLNAVEEPALDYRTGYVIADARGPFARSVLIRCAVSLLEPGWHWRGWAISRICWRTCSSPIAPDLDARGSRLKSMLA